jgi:hypothetical protein
MDLRDVRLEGNALFRIRHTPANSLLTSCPDLYHCLVWIKLAMNY